MKKLARALKKVRAKLKNIRANLRQTEADIKAYRKDNAQDRKERKNLQARLKELRNDLQKAKDDNSSYRIDPLQERIDDLIKRIEFLTDRVNERTKKMKERILRKRHILKRLKFYVAKKTKLRKKWEQAKADHEAGKGTKFETWMLNGCPNVLSDDEEEALALVVVGYDQTCTATSNGGHATGSYHYYSPCRAFDAAGPYYSMIEAQKACRDKWGNNFRELFGPDSWYLKNGYQYGGVFPGHSNHIHVSRNF